MSDPHAVEIKNLSFGYGGAPLLEDVNLTIGAKEFTFVVGSNGSGKTTLLRLILGLLKPDKGEIRILGETPVRARRNIGYVPQSSSADFGFPACVNDVVMMGRLGITRKFGPYSRRDKEAARRAMEEMKIERLRDHSFFSLSGGEIRRTLIARALASEPEMLVLDEPTAGLDMNAEARIYELLGELGKRMSIILVSHDVLFVSSLAKNVVCVKHSVNIHPSAQIDDEFLKDVFGSSYRIVRHDHDLKKP